jgi:hypothetical protein
MEDFMHRNIDAVATALLLLSISAFAQETSAPDRDSDGLSKITVRGCLRSERGNYILIADRTGMVYALQGVGNKLNHFLRKEVEVTGESKPGSVKTGIRPEKEGSDPSDTVHGVDGVPLEVKDINSDIGIVAKHCKAADQQ